MSDKISVLRLTFEGATGAMVFDCSPERFAEGDGLLDELRLWISEGPPMNGDRAVIECHEMTREQFDALPEFQGW